MQDQMNANPAPQGRVPWNKGKLTGAKPPLRPKHVWSIRTKLQIEGRARDFAMFNPAIDSKLRGCDVAAFRVEDVAARVDMLCPTSHCRFVPISDTTAVYRHLVRRRSNVDGTLGRMSWPKV